ncbi:hypothetical protein PPH41_10915, partial [Burkholderia gladioli]|nr:hypothetical protein [Burkholderia gladioli]
GLQSRAMNALRHFLLRGGVATRLLWGLLLAVLLSRALISGAVMLDPDGPDAGAVVLCSGHGPLDLTPAALQANEDLSRALGSALSPTPDTHHQRAGASAELCPFSASLAAAIALAVVVLVGWARLDVVARRAAPRLLRFRQHHAHARPGARAPPRSLPA